MAEKEFYPNSKIPISIEYHPSDLANAEAAARMEGMKVDDFISLATHEKVKRLVADGRAISHAKPKGTLHD